MSGVKRVTLTIKQRMDVLNDLEIASVQQVAGKYNVNARTIRRIKNNAASILRLAEDKDQRKRRRLKGPQHPELEQQLYTWFLERRTLGDRLTDALLLQKANQLMEGMPSNSTSRLTMGWLVNFKKRNNIRLVRLYEEKASVDEDAAHIFVKQFSKEIEEEDINVECIYNMDESGLLWKALPQKALINNQKSCVSDHKEKKERISIALCANANGTHKIKPFLIHKSKKPRALKHCLDQLPVLYASQKKAWMNQELFLEWFNHFKNSVQLFQLQKGFSSKVILLAENRSAYQLPANYVVNCNIEIRYLPPNTASLIQPMDQGIIEITKRCFRHKLIQRVLTYGGGVNEFYQNYTIKDCIDIVASAWENVTSYNIKNSWNNLLPHTHTYTEVGNEEEEEEEEEDEDEVEEASNIVAEMRGIVSKLSPCNISVKDVTHFLSACNEKERRNSGEEQVSNEDEESNEEDESTDEEMVQDGDRDEHVVPTFEVLGISLSAEEREELENTFKELEKYEDRASYPLRMNTQALKLYYLGDSSIYDRPVRRVQDG